MTDSTIKGGSLCCLFVVLSIGSAIGITELVMYNKYKDDNQGCDNNQVVSPVTWLLVDGIIQIGVHGIIFLLGVWIYCTLDGLSILASCARCLLCLVYMFSFAWLIVGCVMFWRDNLQCEPMQLNNTFWVILILKLVSLNL